MHNCIIPADLCNINVENLECDAKGELIPSQNQELTTSEAQLFVLIVAFFYGTIIIINLPEESHTVNSFKVKETYSQMVF